MPIYFLSVQCIVDLAYLAFVGDLIISGIALYIIATYVTDYKVVTTNMPMKAVLRSAFLFSAKEVFVLFSFVLFSEEEKVIKDGFA